MGFSLKSTAPVIFLFSAEFAPTGGRLLTPSDVFGKRGWDSSGKKKGFFF